MFILMLKMMYAPLKLEIIKAGKVTSGFKCLFSIESCYLLCISFDQKSGYLGKESEMCTKTFIRMLIMVFMVGKKTEAPRTVVGNLVVDEL